MPSILRRNILANISGQAWSAVLGLLLVPVYLHYMGVEAYGLVGFFASLQAIIAVLDMGLGTTANREVARRTARAETAGESRNLVRTLEIIYWTVGLLIAVLFYAVSDLIATRWVQVRELSVDTVQWAVVILGLTVAVRWPVALYTGVIRGLEKQVLLNGLTAGASTLRGIGAVGVLIFVSPTVAAFLVWQLIAGTIEVAVFGWTAWRNLPGDRDVRHSFDTAILRTIWRFAAGMSGISILITILKQLDKVLISKLLPLEQLGYYTTASIAGMGLYLFITPMFNAVFPRFSSLVSHQDTVSVADTFHRSAQFLSFVVAPMAGVLIFFSHDVLLLWTRSEAVASNAQLALSFFAFGTLMNGMVTVPYALQLASGLAWIALIVNALSVVVLVPLIYVLVNRFGIAGGA
ncbi:MAG TPA: oligosaccharide flippase family protein, partial [Nitrospiria bacterium]